MALRAKQLAALYTKLSPVIGEEETDALLSELPVRQEDEPVTKHYLRAELDKLAGELRVEMQDMRADLKRDITHGRP